MADYQDVQIARRSYRLIMNSEKATFSPLNFMMIIVFVALVVMAVITFFS